MALLNHDVFEAFGSAGIPDEKARRAAEALWDGARASDLAGVKADAAELNATVKLRAWILGFNAAMLAALLLQVFSN